MSDPINFDDPDVQAAFGAAYAVESVHHIHVNPVGGLVCMCGFKAARAREMTAHIARLTLANLLGQEVVDVFPPA